jgi:hypothetical protein
VFEIHHGQVDLSGEIGQRNRECAERHYKEDCHPVFMRDVEKRGAKRHDQEQRSGDAAGYGPHDRSIDQGGTRLGAWLVAFEFLANGIVAHGGLRQNRPVDDPVEPGDQDGDETRQRPEQECWGGRLRDYG